jgi:hypothetical protein
LLETCLSSSLFLIVDFWLLNLCYTFSNPTILRGTKLKCRTVAVYTASEFLELTFIYLDIGNWAVLFFFLLLCWVGVHCSIYKGSYHVSNISYLN